MALADPQSVTISGAAKSLSRIAPSDPRSGAFQDPTSEYLLTVATTESKTRRRTMSKLTDTKIVADTFIPTQSTQISASVHIVMDRPTFGYTNAELLAIAKGFVASLTDAQLTAIIAGQV